MKSAKNKRYLITFELEQEKYPGYKSYPFKLNEIRRHLDAALSFDHDSFEYNINALKIQEIME